MVEPSSDALLCLSGRIHLRSERLIEKSIRNAWIAEDIARYGHYVNIHKSLGYTQDSYGKPYCFFLIFIKEMNKMLNKNMFLLNNTNQDIKLKIYMSKEGEYYYSSSWNFIFMISLIINIRIPLYNESPLILNTKIVNSFNIGSCL